MICQHCNNCNILYGITIYPLFILNHPIHKTFLHLSSIMRKIQSFLLVQNEYIIPEVILHQEFMNAEHYAPHPHYTYISSFNTFSSAELLTLFISPTHLIWSVAFNSSVIPAPAFICSTRETLFSHNIVYQPHANTHSIAHP